jgi:hypothetical protein
VKGRIDSNSKQICDAGEHLCGPVDIKMNYTYCTDKQCPINGIKYEAAVVNITNSSMNEDAMVHLS